MIKIVLEEDALNVLPDDSELRGLLTELNFRTVGGSNGINAWQVVFDGHVYRLCKYEGGTYPWRMVHVTESLHDMRKIAYAIKQGLEANDRARYYDCPIPESGSTWLVRESESPVVVYDVTNELECYRTRLYQTTVSFECKSRVRRSLPLHLFLRLMKRSEGND